MTLELVADIRKRLWAIAGGGIGVLTTADAQAINAEWSDLHAATHRARQREQALERREVQLIGQILEEERRRVSAEKELAAMKEVRL